MHISGKILAWLVVIGGMAAIFLSAQALAIRNGWMTQAQKNEAAFVANQQQIQIKTRELEAKRVELARTMLGWDRFWPLAQATIRQGELTLTGAISGIQVGQTIYVFAFGETGDSKFLGEFKVTKAADQAAAARPNWFLRVGDLTEGVYQVRVRTAIPNQFQTRLGEIDQHLLAADLVVSNNEIELARQGQLIGQTDKLIAGRLSEINGAPDLEGKNLPDVNIKGLIAAMSDEEQARNVALLQADRLQRALKLAREQFQETVKANAELTKALPQPNSIESNLGAAKR
ncbi:MAG: hypothetical protein EXS05_17060 [Planctomycetaceae bacterium]|nr:hypothetical protein [Planctomycetaceae bacterium]